MSKATKKQSKNMSKTTTTAPATQPAPTYDVRALEMKLDKARWKILSFNKEPDMIFYGQLCMNLPDRITPGIPTACTNGKCIRWGPEFLEKLTSEETCGVLVHETLHCALGHLWRFDMKNPDIGPKANMACDYAINLTIDDLKQKGVAIALPQGGLLDRKWVNMAEEEIFNKLPDPPKVYVVGFGEFEAPGEDGDGKGKGEKDGDGEKNGKGAGNSIKESLRDKWERAVISAAQAARATGQGTLPADLQRMIDERLVQKIDWKAEMVDFVKNCMSERNDWTRSSRRHAHAPVIMPRKKKDSVSRVVFVRDTSGSICQNELSAFNALIQQCVSEMNCFGLIVDCDADIAGEYSIGPGIDAPNTAKGGGGTDFRPPFSRIEELETEGEPIAGLIYLTDLAGTFPEPPDFPTLWLSITKEQAPFGRTVFFEI